MTSRHLVALGLASTIGVSVTGCSSSSESTAGQLPPDRVEAGEDAEAPDADGSPKEDGATADAQPADVQTDDAAGCIPAVDAKVEPALPTRATGADAKVTLGPGCSGWKAHWTWRGPGKEVGGDQAHVADLKKGEPWKLEAWAEGPGGLSATHETVDFVVANSLPTAGTVVIEPTAPLPAQALEAKITSQPADPDDDPLTLAWSWELDGASTSAQEPNIAAGITLAHQVWKVAVVASETGDPSASGPQFSATTSIDVFPPSAPLVAITPAQPNPGETLHAAITAEASDPNGETITYSYAWKRNQSLTSITASDLPGSQVKSHDVWEVEVRAKNSLKEGPPATASVTVVNQPPSIQLVTLDPMPFNASTGVNAVVQGVQDADGDPVSTSFVWRVNGVEVANTIAKLSGAFFRRGDVVQARAVVTDDHDGQSLADSQMVAAENAPPSAPKSPAFSPMWPTGNESATITAEIPADPDGDTVTLMAEWFRDGITKGISADVTRTNLQLNDAVWTAKVAASDGIEESSWVTVPGATHLCPDPGAPLTWMTTSDYKMARYSVWDPRSCALNMFTEFYSGRAIDPRTGLFVQPTLSKVPKGPGETLDLRAGLWGYGEVDPYSKALSWGVRTPPYVGVSSSGDALYGGGPDDFKSGKFVGSGVVRGTVFTQVIYALLDYTTTSNVRKLLLLHHASSGGTKHEESQIPVGSLPDLSTARQSNYHAPTKELMIGPTRPDLEIWGVNVETGATRKVRKDTYDIGWQYDVWSNVFRGFMPYKGYGLGTLDPTTGQVSWHQPGNGFQLPPIEQPVQIWEEQSQSIGYVPAEGSSYAIYEKRGMVRVDKSTDSLRDATFPIPYSHWTHEEKNEPIDVVARSATGTVIVLGIGPGNMLSMGRLFEVDVAKGTTTWLTPAEGSEAPRWVNGPAIAYDAAGDSLWVHGGSLGETVATGETWRFWFATRQWTKYSVGGPARVDGTLMVDEAHDRLLYTGGRTPPLTPAPPWKHDVWSLDLTTGKWSVLWDAGTNAPPDLWYGRAAIDLAGDRLYIYGGYYNCSNCFPAHAIHSRDLKTGLWSSGKVLPSDAVAPTVTYYWWMGNNVRTAVSESRADRVFLAAGRACDFATRVGYGLMKVGWDEPAPAWSFAVEDSGHAQYLGHLAYDPVNKQAHSIWAYSEENGSVCHDQNPPSNSDDAVWSWP